MSHSALECRYMWAPLLLAFAHVGGTQPDPSLPLPPPPPSRHQCELVRQTSLSPCERGRTFGCDFASRSMWVANCRGAFRCASSVVHCGYPPGRRAYNCSCVEGSPPVRMQSAATPRQSFALHPQFKAFMHAVPPRQSFVHNRSELRRQSAVPPRQSFVYNRSEFQWMEEWELGVHSEELSLRDIGFVVMASLELAFRTEAVLETWARHLERDNLILATADAGELGGRRLSANATYAAGYAAAQSRQFIEMLKNTRLKAKRWVVLVDDDTWVNTRHLVHWLSRFPSAAPLLVGRVLLQFSCVWGAREGPISLHTRARLMT